MKTEHDTYIFGLRAILEAIKNNESIGKVFLLKSAHSPLMQELSQLIRKHNIAFTYVPVEKLNRLSKHNNHQGGVAQIAPITFHELETLIEKAKAETSTPLFLLLDQISDVRNFGAIIRTASCTGVNGVIMQKHGSAPVNAEVVKTSAGGIFSIPICKVDHIKDALFALQAADIQIVAATEKTETSIYETDLTKPTALILGAEDKGISTSVLKMADYRAKLPLVGAISSLNVSVACGAFLYEAVRQRKFAS